MTAWLTVLLMLIINLSPLTLLDKFFHSPLIPGLSSVTCPVLTVTNADFADCNGDYSVTGERVAWAGDRPVYAHADKDRYQWCARL